MEKCTMNQRGNLANKYQTEAKRVLSICSAGMLRSPTIANVLYQEYGYNTRSCGASDFALIKVSEALLLWADEVIIVNADVVKYLSEEAYLLIKEKLVVLDLPDEYPWNDANLISEIKHQYRIKD